MAMWNSPDIGDLRLSTDLRRRIGALICRKFGCPWRYEPAQYMHGGHSYGPFRVCDRCHDITLLLGPPPGHPESLETELELEEEELLAWWDDSLFPDDLER